jgi:uncharacterized protein (TIGR02996 family)
VARHPELEAKLVENPGDIETRLVYADFLQSQGDPRGELIVLQHRYQGQDFAPYLEKHKGALLGPLVRFVKTSDHDPQPALEWHLGFIRSARLAFPSPIVDGSTSYSRWDQADKAVADLLTHPSGMLLEELTVTMYDGMPFDAVCSAIAMHDAPALRDLRLGAYYDAGPGAREVVGYHDPIPWCSLGDASLMWAALPRLESLRIQVGLRGETAEIGELDLPCLEKLEVVTYNMASRCLRSFASGKLPAAKYIDLWTGSSRSGGDGTLDDLEPLLAGDHVPALEHLGIMNCEFTDQVVAALAGSKILPRLREVSLAHGMMTDDGVRVLTEHADAFEHLDLLDLRGNFIRGPIPAICKQVVGWQREWHDGQRYVALAE